MSTRTSTTYVVALLLALTTAPCHAWLYDAGPVQRAGTSIGVGQTCEWIAAPFAVTQDSYATALWAAISRAGGTAGAGFDVYLTTTLLHLPDSAMCKLPEPLVPVSPIWTYRSGTLAEPVLLHAGAYYALVLIPNAPDLYGGISYGNTSGTYFSYGTVDHGKSWTRLPRPVCIRVDGYAVPEPASVCALIPAFFLVPLLKKRAR